LTKTLISLSLAGALAAASITTPVLSTRAHASSFQAHASSAARLSGSSLVSTALAYAGSRYAYVGDTPYTGFSCTGFVHWVYSQFGYNTPEDVGALYYGYPHVAPGALQPGDVLIFANTFHAGLSHAAIYIGGSQMVGADNFSVGVRVDNMYDGYWGPRFVGAVRIATYASAPVQQVWGTAIAVPRRRATSPCQPGRARRGATFPA
jgi:cell wall-associated NlpC family hydrolase